MKKSVIFILIAMLAVSFTSVGSAEPNFIKKAKDEITGKDDKKKEEKKKEEKKKEEKKAKEEKEKKAKEDKAKKEQEKEKEKNEKKPVPVPVSKDAVLVKGLQISWCGNEVADDGSITIPGLQGVTLPVKGGKFDLVVPVNPAFGDEWGLNQQSGFSELDFGTAKVNSFRIIYFSNSNTSKSREETADGRGGLPFSIYYSDSDVKGTIDGQSVELKKGWNIIGDKTQLEVSLMCAG